MGMMHGREIIKLNDSMVDIMVKMSEGNPGALTVCTEILKRSKELDPLNVLGGVGAILSLDTLGIRADRIWILFKDVCGEDLKTMLMVLRAEQLGKITDSQIFGAIDRCEPFDAKAAAQMAMDELGYNEPAAEVAANN